MFCMYENGGIGEKSKLLSCSGAEILRIELAQLAVNWPNWVRNISVPEHARMLCYSLNESENASLY